MKLLIQLIAVIGFSLFAVSKTNAQIVTSALDDGSLQSLRQQINIAAPGDVITISSALTTISLNSEIVIDKDLTIESLANVNTVIDANSSGRLFRIVSGVVELNNLSLTNGLAQDGGAIFNESGTLIINNCVISNSTANGASGSGGAIYNNTGGSLTINNSTISGNTANRAGGGIEDNSGSGLGLVLNEVVFIENNAGVSPAMGAPGNGGALHITGSGHSMITNCTVSGNSASLEGGGLWNGSGAMMIKGTTITDNTALGAMANEGGGGVFNAGGSVSIDSSSITLNTVTGASASGGGILNDLGVLTVTNTEISGNTSVRAGGGIEDNSTAGNTLTLTNVQLMDNTTASAPGNGGGLHITGPGHSMISACTVSGNSASLEGGGLWNGSGNMFVKGTTITNNTALGAMANEGGGGVFNAGGSVSIDSSSITLNTVTGASASGGGILNDLGVLTVTNTEISGNTSVRAGGGIEDNSTAGNTLTLTNVQLMDNTTASAPGNGGGLHITGPGNSMISACTVSGNSAASEGGGLWNGSGIMTIKDAIIENNEATGAEADNGGGGIFNNGGTLNVTSNTVVEGNIANGASGSGGGLLSTDGEVFIENTAFSNNSANRAGGAIEMINGNLTFEYSSMLGNDVNGGAGMAAPGNGGGLHVTGNTGTILISDALINNNEAAREGGGLWNQSGTSMVVTRTTLDQNASFGNAQDDGGAAIFNNGGILEVSNSTISNNTDMGANSSGAGIHNNTNGDVDLTLTTISGNSSNEGGGIYNNGNSFDVNAVTIADNNASVSGGGIKSINIVSIKNSIIATNSSLTDADVSGAFMSNDYNLIGRDDGNAFPEKDNDIEGADPKLAPLSNNGNQTSAHQLQEGSAAYNAGDPNDQFTDQNNQAVFGGRRDIGADESQFILTKVKEVAIHNSGIKMYPNPVSNFLTLKIPQEFGDNVKVRIFEAGSGRFIESNRINSSNPTLDFGNYALGMYYVQITSADFTTAYLVAKVK